MSSSQGLSDHVALRIGMAARSLPALKLEDWMSVIIRAVGLPLTAQRLSRLRLNRLRQTGRHVLASYSDAQLRHAIAILRGQGVDLRASLPDVDNYQLGDMPGSIRVACASNRGDRIDAPFGTCDRFLIYQVSAQEIRLIDMREVPDLSPLKDKYTARVSLIEDCHVLYALTIGGPASSTVINAGLHPIKIGAPKRAPEMLVDLQQVLDDAPPPWLMKIMEASARHTWSYQQERLP